MSHFHILLIVLGLTFSSTVVSLILLVRKDANVVRVRLLQVEAAVGLAPAEPAK